MAKFNLSGKNPSRNKADAEAIQSDERYIELVEKTKEVLEKPAGNDTKESTSAHENSSNKNKRKKQVEETEQVDATLKEVAGSTGAFQKLQVSKLVAAPADWNQFSKVPQETKVLLAESIHANGLLQPIVVRALDSKGEQYQILAGHTRTEMYKVLHDITGDEKYLTIDAKVFNYGEVNDDQAREIITDTNAIQRGTLTPRDRAFCVYTKMKALKKRSKRGGGDVMSKVASQMKIKRTSVYYWQKLKDISSDFEKWYGDGEISLISAAKIASYPKAVQGILYRHRTELNDKRIKQLPADLTEENADEAVKSIIRVEMDKKDFKVDATVNGIGYDEGYGEVKVALSNWNPENTSIMVLFAPDEIKSEILKKYGQYIVPERQ